MYPPGRLRLRGGLRRGRERPVRRLLFDAFWVNAVDLGDAKVVRTLLVDAIRSGSSDSEALREWGYAIDVTGAPITTPGHRLLRTWRDEWLRVGAGTVPVLVADGGELIIGTAAVQWLGEEITVRGLAVESAPATEPATDWIRRDLPDLSWTSQHGGRWNRAYQDAHMRDPGWLRVFQQLPRCYRPAGMRP